MLVLHYVSNFLWRVEVGENRDQRGVYYDDSLPFYFPSYYIDEDAVECLEGSACLVRSGGEEGEESGEVSVGCDSCDRWYHAACVGFDTNNSSNTMWICPRCTAQSSSQSETETGLTNLLSQSGRINQRAVNQPEVSMDTFAINSSQDVLSPTQTLGNIAAAVANLLGSRNILDLHLEARGETAIGELRQFELQRETRENQMGERLENPAQVGSRHCLKSEEKTENVEGTFICTQERIRVGGNTRIAEEETSFIEPGETKTGDVAAWEEVELNDDKETPREESKEEQVLVTTEGVENVSLINSCSQGTDVDGGNSERVGGSNICDAEVNEELGIPNEEQSFEKEPAEEEPAAAGQEMFSSRKIEEPAITKPESSVSPGQGTDGDVGDLERLDDNTCDAADNKELKKTGVVEENLDELNRKTVTIEVVDGEKVAAVEEQKQSVISEELKPVQRAPFAERPIAVENRVERVRPEGKRKRPSLLSTEWSSKRPSLVRGSFQAGDSCSTPGSSFPVCQLSKSDKGRESPRMSRRTAGTEMVEHHIGQQMGSCRWRKILKREDDQEESIGKSVIAKIREDRIKNAGYGAGQSLEVVDVSDDKFLTAYRGAVARLKEKQRQEEGLVRTTVGQLHGKQRRTSKFGDKVRENLAKKLYGRGRGLNTYDRDWDIEFWKRKVLKEKTERERVSGSSCIAGGSTIQKKVEKAHFLPKKDQKTLSVEETACQGLRKANVKGKEEQVDLVELVKDNCMRLEGGKPSEEVGGTTPVKDERGQKRKHRDLGNVAVVLKPDSLEEGGEMVDSQQEDRKIEVKMQEHLDVSIMDLLKEVKPSTGNSEIKGRLEEKICVGNRSLSPEKSLEEKVIQTLELSRDSINMLRNLEAQDGSLTPHLKLLPEVTPLAVEPEAQEVSVELKNETEESVLHLKVVPELQECKALEESEVRSVRTDSANEGRESLETQTIISKPEVCISGTAVLECTQHQVSKSTPTSEAKKTLSKKDVEVNEKSGGDSVLVLGKKRARVSGKAMATSVVTSMVTSVATPVSTAIAEKGPVEGGISTMDKEREARRSKALEMLARKGGGGGSHDIKNQKPSVNAKSGGAVTSESQSEFRCLVSLPDDMRPIVPLNLRSRVPTSIRQVYLSRWVECYLRRLRSPLGRNQQCEAAVKEAVTSESEIFRQSPTKGQYLSLSIRALARAESEVQVETVVSDIGEGEGRVGKESEARLAVERALVATGLVDDDEGDVLPVGESEDCNRDVKLEPLETKTEALETKSELLETKAEPLETKLDFPGANTETLKTKTEPPETKNLLETKVETPEEKSEAPKSHLEAPETESEPLDTHSPDTPVTAPFRDLEGPSTDVTVLMETVSSNPSSGIPVVSDFLEERELRTTESKREELGLETKEDIEDLEKRMEKVRAEIDLQHSLAEEWQEETWTETNSLPSVKIPSQNRLLLDEKIKNVNMGAKKREQHVKQVSETAKLSEKDHRLKKTSDEMSMKTAKDDTSKNWSVQEKVKSYVKEYLKPLVRSGVVTAEQYKWAVEKTASKVLQHHRGTESAEFLITEGASVRKLAEQYLGTWRKRASVI